MEETKRIYEFDLARAFLLCCLPFIHIMEFWGDMYGFANMLSFSSTASLNTLCEILCLFVAPTFMVLMGSNMVFTKRNSPKDFLRRGLLLLSAELLLNLLRYELPGLISLGFAKSEEGTNLLLFAMRLGILNSDILAFAGLAFLSFALLKKTNLKPLWIAIAFLLLYALDYVWKLTLLPLVYPSLPYDVANLLGNFLYIDGNSTFPLLEWLPFIGFGYLLGHAIKNKDAEGRKSFLMKLAIPASTISIAVILGVAFLSESPIKALSKGEGLSPLGLLGEVAFSFSFICLVQFVYSLLRLEKKKAFNRWVSSFSKNTTYFYAVQWIIVGFGMMLGIALSLNSKIIPLWGTLLCYLSILFASYILGNSLHILFSFLIRKRKNR